MPENPFTREVAITLLELVPQHGQLPLCHGQLRDGVTRCPFRAKYMLNNRPVCGRHGGPTTVFFPERMIKE